MGEELKQSLTQNDSSDDLVKKTRKSKSRSMASRFLWKIAKFFLILLHDLKDSSVAMFVWSQNTIAVVILLYFVGNKGDEETSGIVGFGISWINITVFFPMSGCSAFVTTIISQEIGKNNFSCIFPILYKSMFINMIVFGICFSLFILTTPLTFGWMGLFEGAHIKGALFTILLAIQGIPMGFFFSLSFVLLSLKKSNALAVILLVGIVSFFLLCLVLIQGCGAGLFVIALIPFSQLLILVSLSTLYIIFTNDESIKDIRELPSRASLNNTLSTLKKALISAVNITLEWTGEEINIMLSTIFGNAGISAFSALYYLNVLSWSIGNGLSTCTAMQMANALGAEDIKLAKKFIKKTYRYSLISSLIYGFFLFMTRDRMGGWFYPEEDIKQTINNNMWILCMTSSLENMQVAIGNIVRNIGWFHKNAVSCLVSFYLISFPITLFLLFGLGLEVEGLLIGWAIGGGSMCIINLYFLLRINWKTELKRIKNQIEIGALPAGGGSHAGSLLSF